MSGLDPRDNKQDVVIAWVVAILIHALLFVSLSAKVGPKHGHLANGHGRTIEIDLVGETKEGTKAKQGTKSQAKSDTKRSEKSSSLQKQVSLHKESPSPQSASSASSSVESYTKAIETNPKDATAYNDRADAYAKQSKFTKAIFDYTKAIEINPNLKQAYYGRGRAYFKEKEYDQAWADVSKAEELGASVDPDLMKKLVEKETSAPQEAQGSPTKQPAAPSSNAPASGDVRITDADLKSLPGGQSSSGDSQCSGDQHIMSGLWQIGSCSNGTISLSCDESANCSSGCEGADCNYDCGGNAKCNFQCQKGNCNYTCADNATCNFQCQGGNCNFKCKDPDSAKCNFNSPNAADQGPPDDDKAPNNDHVTSGTWKIACNDGLSCSLLCDQSASCVSGCSGGACNYNCGDNATCNFQCPKGDCNYTCSGEATCNFQCDGGNCNFKCDDTAKCNFQCQSGTCNFEGNNQISPQN